jgi:hypothetical protein
MREETKKGLEAAQYAEDAARSNACINDCFVSVFIRSEGVLKVLVKSEVITILAYREGRCF